MIGHKITKCMIFRFVHTNISRYTKYKENKNIEIFKNICYNLILRLQPRDDTCVIANIIGTIFYILTMT